MASIFKAPGKDDPRVKAAKRRKKNAPKNILKKIVEIRMYICKFMYVDSMGIQLLRSSIDSLEENYNILSDDEDMKRRWEKGMPQTINRLVALNNEIAIMQRALKMKLNKNKALDELIKELDQRYAELDRGN